MKALHYIISAALAAPLLLSSCSDAGETDSPVSPAGDDDTPGNILFGCSAQPAISWASAVESRGGASIPAALPSSIGVYGYNNYSGGQSYQGGGEVFNNVQAYRLDGPLYEGSGISSWLTNPGTSETNRWPYERPMPWLNEYSGVKYKFFAYSPYSSESGAMDVYGRSYESFESVEWHHVPKYTSQDYVVADRIVEYTSRSTDNAVQVFSLRHLQSRIRFCFKLGPHFSTMRMIRVRSLQVVSHRGFLYTVTMRYTAVTEGDKTVLRPTINWTIEDSTDPTDYILDNEPDPLTTLPIDYIELSSDADDYQAIASLYAYPGDNLTALQIKVTYDVYDYYPGSGAAPVLLREGDTADNTVPLTFRASTSTTGSGPKLEAGYYYDVRIIVEPSYLYVLSDNDFDADGYLIIADE